MRLSKIPDEDFEDNKNGTFDVSFEQQFTANIDRWNSDELCFFTFENVTGLATCLDVPLEVHSICKSRFCLPLCCEKTKISSLSQNKTIKDCNKPTNYKNPKWINLSVSNDDGKDKESPYYLTHNLNDQCTEFKYIDADEDHLDYEKTPNGYYLKMDDGMRRFTDHCIAQYEDESGSRSFKIRLCKNHEWYIILNKNIGPALSAISVFVLLITFAIVWYNDRFKIQGSLRLFLLASNILFFLLISMKSDFKSISLNHKNFCTFIAFATQFAYNSIMCWVSVLAYDIWRQFKFAKVSNKSNKRNVLGFLTPKFRPYLLFSLIIPLTITILTIILSNLPEGYSTSYTQPELGNGRCFFSGKSYYLYRVMPSGLIFTVALVFMFMFIHIYLWSGMYKKQYVKKGDEAENAGKIFKAKVVVRAVVLMGMVWVVELVSNFISLSHGALSTTTLAWDSFATPISCLNGLWLSLAILANTSEIRKMKRNYQKFMNRNAPKNQKGKKTKEIMTVEPTRETNDIKTDADESNICQF